VSEEIEMLDLAGNAFHSSDVLNGKTTPVFFGAPGITSAFSSSSTVSSHMPNRAAPDEPGTVVPVDGPAFSGFIFKIRPTWTHDTATGSHFCGSAQGSFYGT